METVLVKDKIADIATETSLTFTDYFSVVSVTTHCTNRRLLVVN